MSSKTIMYTVSFHYMAMNLSFALGQQNASSTKRNTLRGVKLAAHSDDKRLIVLPKTC